MALQEAGYSYHHLERNQTGPQLQRTEKLAICPLTFLLSSDDSGFEENQESIYLPTMRRGECTIEVRVAAVDKEKLASDMARTI